MIMINWKNLLKATGITCAIFALPLVLKVLIDFMGAEMSLLILVPVIFIIGIYLIYRALNF